MKGNRRSTEAWRHHDAMCLQVHCNADKSQLESNQDAFEGSSYAKCVAVFKNCIGQPDQLPTWLFCFSSKALLSKACAGQVKASSPATAAAMATCDDFAPLAIAIGKAVEQLGHGHRKIPNIDGIPMVSQGPLSHTRWVQSRIFQGSLSFPIVFNKG